mmetsp:Transcript_16892/g.43373  ORF Transcript_16892/g.43373 Transcript_16892/m.43373 type:complete len:312 (-) Transcript_16892:195-1130(-)
MGVKKLLAYYVLLHMAPKCLPFPFFIPVYLILMGLMVCIAGKGTERNIVIGLLAFQFAPYTLTITKDLKDIESWGNKGPNEAPMKGVYLFNGLGAATIDFSQCLWAERTKSAYCHLHKVMSVYAEAGVDLEKAGFQVTADGGSTGPGKDEMKRTMPWPLFWFVYHVAHHNRLDFYFNDDLTEAQVYENVCLAITASPSPLALLFPYGICTTATVYPLFRVFTMVRDSSEPPRWYRNTYFQEKELMSIYDGVKVSDKQSRAGGTVYPAKMNFGDGYQLMPLLTPGKGGTSILHKNTLKLALNVKSKLITRDF